MSRRNFNKETLINTLKLYKKPMDARGLDGRITHLSTPRIEPITEEMIESLDFYVHDWRAGDKFYKLSHKYYGDSKLWWIIAWFNQKPTDHHPKIGEEIYIPNPITRLLGLLDI